MFINCHLILTAFTYCVDIFSCNNLIKPSMHSKTQFYCPLIHRQTCISPWNYQVPFSPHVKNFVIMPSLHIAIKWSIYCWLSLDIMLISYVTCRWFYRCLIFLQVGLQAIKVNWSSCTNTPITVNSCMLKIVCSKVEKTSAWFHTETWNHRHCNEIS